MTCICCDLSFVEDSPHYSVLEIGSERTAFIEAVADCKVAAEHELCDGCFSILVHDWSPVITNTVRKTKKTQTCVQCQRPVCWQHSHLLSEGLERNEIAKRKPQQITPGGRICYVCWLAIRINVKQQYDKNNRQLRIIISCI